MHLTLRGKRAATLQPHSWVSWAKSTGSEDLSRSTVQNSYSLQRFEEAQKAPTKGGGLSRTPVLLPPSATGQWHSTGPTCLPFSSRPPAPSPAPGRPRLQLLLRSVVGRGGRGDSPRPWARPGLPPLPALLSPTRPRAHQAAEGEAAVLKPRSPAGPTGPGERSAEIPPGAASSRPGLSQGKHDAGGEPPISRGYREALARAPATPRLRSPPPPVRGHARLAAEGGAAGQPAAGVARLGIMKALLALGMETLPKWSGFLQGSSASTRKSRQMLLHKND